MKEAFLSWTLSALQSQTTLYTLLCIENPHLQTDIGLEFQPSNICKKSVIQALTHRARMVYSNPELLAKEMDYLNKVLCRNSYPDWFLKKPNNRPQIDQGMNQKTTKESFVTVPYIQRLRKEFRRIFKDTEVQIIFKGCNTVETLSMHP